jgi:hypothetical protein
MESFKLIPGYDPYSVSVDGVVFNTKTQNTVKSYLNKFGYRVIVLSVKGKPISTTIHKLVATAYIPNTLERKEINHKNGIKTDNRVENLEWCTRSENIKHAVNSGLLKVKNGYEHYMSRPILQFTKEDVFIKEWPSALQIQKELGFKQANISKVCNGNRRLASGFKWKFKYDTNKFKKPMKRKRKYNQ